VRIKRVDDVCRDVKRFTLDRALDCKPGQFVQLTVFGIGEAPISISSAPGEELELSVKKIGSLTTALHRMKEGDKVGIRGPYGKGYPEFEEGGRVVLVGGGIGLAPLRSFLRAELGKREMQLFYGSRTSADLAFSGEYGEWQKNGVEVHTVIGAKEEGWSGPVGNPTDIMDPVWKDASALLCGPPVMINFVLKKLEEKGIPRSRAYVSMERLMKCGIGKCGHCQVDGTYVCKSGPVFRADSMPSEVP
jgi:NAD(P)H-flavin reductase